MLNESNKSLLHSSFISCYFNYCCVLWHFCNTADTFKIAKLQEKALRYSMLDLKSSYKQLLHNCGKSTLFFTAIAKADGSNLQDTKWIVSVDIITVDELQQLRCQARLLAPRFCTILYGKKSLSYLSPVLWNTLDNDIKQCNVLNAFKKRVKLWKGPTCNCDLCTQCRISKPNR